VWPSLASSSLVMSSASPASSSVSSRENLLKHTVATKSTKFPRLTRSAGAPSNQPESQCARE